jgi:uncharacterized SAM-binding protein YcdF (DUF218 family)
VSGVVDFAFSAGGIVVAVLLGVLWLWMRPLSRGPRRFLAAVAIGYGLAAIYGVDYWIGRVLVAGYHPFVATDVSAGPVAVVVMGSGSFTARDWDGNAYSMPDRGAASRVLEAVRVYHLVNPDVVISSGGKVHPDDPWIATAEAMRDALLQLGVPASRIALQTKSRNTFEEAVDNAKLCDSLKIRRIIVVTSDFHMKRTMGAFRAAGVEAIPAIAQDPYALRFWFEWLLPTDLGLMKASMIAHEVLGISYYAVRGWYRF